MEDPASITHHCQMMMMMMMNSQDNNETLNDDNIMCLDPSDLFFEQESDSSSSKANQNSVVTPEIATTARKEVKAEKNTMTNGVWSACTSASSCSPPSGQLISFGSSDGFDVKEEPVLQYGDHHLDGTGNHDYAKVKPKTRKRPGAAMPLCTQEHVIAERKRREIMTQRFLALSALIPGLKKVCDLKTSLKDFDHFRYKLKQSLKICRATLTLYPCINRWTRHLFSGMPLST